MILPRPCSPGRSHEQPSRLHAVPPALGDVRARKRPAPVPDADAEIEHDAGTGVHRAADEVGVLADVAKALVEAAEALEGLAPYEEVAERDVVRRADRPAPRIPLVRRNPAADPGRGEQEVRQALGVRRVPRPQVRAADHLGGFRARARPPPASPARPWRRRRGTRARLPAPRGPRGCAGAPGCATRPEPSAARARPCLPRGAAPPRRRQGPPASRRPPVSPAIRGMPAAASRRVPMRSPLRPRAP